MDIIQIVLTLSIVGFLLWLITTFIPMSPIFRNVITVVIVIVLVLWVLQMFGLVGHIGSLRLH